MNICFMVSTKMLFYLVLFCIFLSITKLHVFLKKFKKLDIY